VDINHPVETNLPIFLLIVNLVFLAVFCVIILTFAATNCVYKRAIFQALEELQDCNLRSNIESIRRHVESSLGQEHIWNDTVFLKTVKAMIQNGDIEQCTFLNVGLSPEFKKQRTSTMTALLEKRSQQKCASITKLNYPFIQEHHFEEKPAPVRKPEHAKLKIIPKKIYDLQQ
jgi:hypothetical protein